MFFLDKFWKGNIAPGEGRYYPTKEYSEAVQTMERCDDTLKAHLSQEDYAVFQKYAEASMAATVQSPATISLRASASGHG